jgi:hypothetical protein
MNKIAKSSNVLIWCPMVGNSPSILLR